MTHSCMCKIRNDSTKPNVETDRHARYLSRGIKKELIDYRNISKKQYNLISDIYKELSYFVDYSNQAYNYNCHLINYINDNKVIKLE